MEEDTMKLYIAMIASVIAISGCKKDEDSGEAEAALSACEQVAAEYCACDGVTEDMCTEYSAAISGSNGDETICQSYLDAGVCP
jgi:hypothetical protein